jgi:hypothetical protein
VEILKSLLEDVRRNRPELWPNEWVLHHDNDPAHKALSIKEFLAQKSITETEYSPHSPSLAPNDFWLFPEIKSALDEDFRILKTSKICDDGNESHSTTGVPKIFPTVVPSLS